ncbi:MAG: glycosyltransferase family 2 protein [Bacteroides sp.]|jgi:glycosyltransferase involved in cell wall biosynthesis|nr:glycosyltransferase family 2 protein [Bacteroides sp.]
MLSICIPVYNYDVRPLVKSLHRQALLLPAPAELLILDDASDPEFCLLNRELSDLDLVRYEELKENAGRSRIRNLLAKKARFPWILFMDCDSETPDEFFLKRYLDETGEILVVCGGRSYLSQPPADDTFLHWWYGTHREVRGAAERSMNPHLSFMTNNFMIPKSILQRIPFNENIKGYGHEDTLLGYELMKNKVTVKHINNPLLHIGLQGNREFLEKSREGVKNLAFINNYLDDGSELAKMVRLLKGFRLLKRLRLCSTFALGFRMLQKPLEANLLGKKPRLKWFDLYKLGYFCQNRHQA